MLGSVVNSWIFDYKQPEAGVCVREGKCIRLGVGEVNKLCNTFRNFATAKKCIKNLSKQKSFIIYERLLFFNKIMWWVQLHFARTWLWCKRLHTRSSIRIEQFIYLNFMFSFFFCENIVDDEKKKLQKKKHCVTYRRTINVRLYDVDSCRSLTVKWHVNYCRFFSTLFHWLNSLTTAFRGNRNSI